MTLAQVRQELKAVKGRRYWRSVDELADSPEFQAAVEKEFPSSAQEWVDPVSRRGFLKLMAPRWRWRGWPDAPSSPTSPSIPIQKRLKI